jgi:RNA polymerase sigma-70 factor (ECF subfamily)
MLIQDLIQTELSDETLAARIVQRDVDALEIIYDRYASRVFTLAAMLADCVEAERIVLQVFSRLWLEVGQFRFHGDTFRDWFLGLSRAHILNRLLRDGRQTAQDRIDAINCWLLEAVSQSTRAGNEVHQPGSQIRVRQALQALTIEQRCVIVLASYGGYKQKEIARLLNWPLSAVEQHARLGLQELRAATMLELVLERGQRDE